MTLQESLFVSCSCELGSGGVGEVGLNFDKGHGSCQSCVFWNCSANNGGAVEFMGLNKSSSMMVLEVNVSNSAFVYCSSGIRHGGALEIVSFVKGTLINNSFICCSSHFTAGAVFVNFYSEAFFSWCVFWNCSAESGGALYLRGVYAHLSDCIFLGNNARNGIGNDIAINMSGNLSMVFHTYTDKMSPDLSVVCEDGRNCIDMPLFFNYTNASCGANYFGDPGTCIMPCANASVTVDADTDDDISNTSSCVLPDACPTGFVAVTGVCVPLCTFTRPIAEEEVGGKELQNPSCPSPCFVDTSLGYSLCVAALVVCREDDGHHTGQTMFAGRKCVMKECAARRPNGSLPDFPCGRDNNRENDSVSGGCFLDMNSNVRVSSSGGSSTGIHFGNADYDKDDNDTTSSAEGVCTLVCAVEEHYEGETRTGRCVEKPCALRAANKSLTTPCGTGECYFNTGWNATIPAMGTECAEQCGPSAHYTPSNSSKRCVLRPCSERTMTVDDPLRPCGPDDGEDVDGDGDNDGGAAKNRDISIGMNMGMSMNRGSSTGLGCYWDMGGGGDSCIPAGVDCANSIFFTKEESDNRTCVWKKCADRTVNDTDLRLPCGEENCYLNPDPTPAPSPASDSPLSGLGLRSEGGGGSGSGFFCAEECVNTTFFHEQLESGRCVPKGCGELDTEVCAQADWCVTTEDAIPRCSEHCSNPGLYEFRNDPAAAEAEGGGKGEGGSRERIMMKRRGKASKNKRDEDAKSHTIGESKHFHENTHVQRNSNDDNSTVPPARTCVRKPCSSIVGENLCAAAMWCVQTEDNPPLCRDDCSNPALYIRAGNSYNKCVVKEREQQASVGLSPRIVVFIIAGCVSATVVVVIVSVVVVVVVLRRKRFAYSSIGAAAPNGQHVSINEDEGGGGESAGRRRIDPYELTDFIGRGSAGCVYIAKHMVTMAVRVIKIIPFDWRIENTKSDGEKGVNSELHIGLALGKKCPFLVNYEEIIVRGYECYIVMEYCERGSMSAMIEAHVEERKPFNEKEITRFVFEIGTAIHVLHTEGVVHRDIKPDNIFCTDKNSFKLGDYGTARFNTARETKQYIGTQGYMAPEVMQGERDCNTAVDVYSFGCILYELLALEHPFRQGNSIQLITNTLSGNTRSLHEAAVAQYSPTLIDLIMRMISVDPTKRPPISSVFALESVMNYSSHLID